MTVNTEWRSVGLMETNPHKMLIRFRNSADKLILPKKEFSALIRGHLSSIPIFSREAYQTVLLGTLPESYCGNAEMTKSGKAVRLSLKDGRIFYLSLSGARDVLEHRRSSCTISEAVGG